MAGDMAISAGRRMRARRKELGLTQPQVATEIKKLLPEMAVDKQRISDWERGYNFPSDRYKPAIVAALQVEELGGFSYFLVSDAAQPEMPEIGEMLPLPFDARLVAMERQLAANNERLGRIEDQLRALLGAASITPGAQGTLSDRIVKTVERALDRRAGEVGRPQPRPAASSGR